MFFNNSYSIKKAKKIIKEQQQKTKEKRNESLQQSSSLRSAASSETQSIRQSTADSSVRSSQSGSQLHLAGSNVSATTAQKNVTYAEHKANKALHSIEATIESQENREQELETKIKDTLIEAKHKMAAGNRRSALRSMKKVKLEQAELNKVSTVIETLEAQKLHIESSLNSIGVLKVMQEGSETLQGLNSKTKTEDIDSVIDGIKDTMEMTAEINDILTAPVDNLLMDDDDLLRELEELTNSADDQQTQNKALNLPSAPTGGLEPNSQKIQEKKFAYAFF